MTQAPRAVEGHVEQTVLVDGEEWDGGEPAGEEADREVADRDADGGGGLREVVPLVVGCEAGVEKLHGDEQQCDGQERALGIGLGQQLQLGHG